MKYNIYISTNVGKVRTNNEDNFLINTVLRKIPDGEVNLRGNDVDEPLVCAVFDGMGGEANGEVASYIAAREGRRLYKHVKKNPDLVEEGVDGFISEANRKIIEEIENSTARRGGSTVAMVYIKDGEVKPYSLGDSRIYLLNDSRLVRISKDHTLAMKKYEANIYTKEEAENSVDSHKLTKFLGVDVDNNGLTAQRYESFTMTKDCKLLLCSDGLYDMCSEDEIERMMEKDSKTISYDLVEAALEKGGVDNITCLVIEVSDE